MVEPQKLARRQKATVVFIDEYGFRLQPLYRRTWSPHGITPVHRTWDRLDRLSAIAVVTLSPQRQQISAPFAMRSRNIVTTDVLNIVKRSWRQLRRPLIVILDRWSVHRAAVKRLQAEGVSGCGSHGSRHTPPS